MIRSASDASYSSEVRLSLKVGEQVFDVGQVLPDRCMIREPVDVAPGTAVLTISVDGQVETKTVMLREGIRVGCSEVLFG